MNPKISDFGIAKVVGGDQLLGKTRTVIGTYGYMSPEYAMKGLFSTKSDVFSFGVIALEVLSSRRNIQYRHPDHDLNLLGHAWRLWIEGNALELVDPLLKDSFSTSAVLRCIQVGLLCVQQQPEDRQQCQPFFQCWIVRVSCYLNPSNLVIFMQHAAPKKENSSLLKKYL